MAPGPSRHLLGGDSGVSPSHRPTTPPPPHRWSSALPKLRGGGDLWPTSPLPLLFPHPNLSSLLNSINSGRALHIHPWLDSASHSPDLVSPSVARSDPHEGGGRRPAPLLLLQAPSFLSPDPAFPRPGLGGSGLYGSVRLGIGHPRAAAPCRWRSRVTRPRLVQVAPMPWIRVELAATDVIVTSRQARELSSRSLDSALLGWISPKSGTSPVAWLCPPMMGKGVKMVYGLKVARSGANDDYVCRRCLNCKRANLHL